MEFRSHRPHYDWTVGEDTSVVTFKGTPITGSRGRQTSGKVVDQDEVLYVAIHPKRDSGVYSRDTLVSSTDEGGMIEEVPDRCRLGMSSTPTPPVGDLVLDGSWWGLPCLNPLTFTGFSRCLTYGTDSL